eukprot:TRINITY_DN6236_c0_g2_i7.p1 TRINITY_DN6236_c0_g2~~TRINITY_DN6236_c0_g2_i7.p1  ORF type:complete len:377 (-),score=81.01 TRINITY_DN6236_c0_g2_i7:1093-2223(-)
MYATEILHSLRAWSQKPIHTIIYTHGHVDHVGGASVFEHEATAKHHPSIQVVAHEKVSERFDRYKLTNRFNAFINQRQFSLEKAEFMSTFRYPDTTYDSELKISVGSVDFNLKHEEGETDDATWVYVPQHKALCTGDLFIWSCPNCGNPQKAQRYPLEWESALRCMAQAGAEILFPGHGLPIFGADRVRQALINTADFLKEIIDQTLDLINQGRSLNDIIHTIKYPTHLMKLPYLKPTYDEPEFIVRNLWRLYAGWYEQNPAWLKPAAEADLAKEWVRIAGGDHSKLVRRAQTLAENGQYRLACEMIEFARLANPGDSHTRLVRAIIYRNRASAETSLMAKAIYNQVGNEELGLSEQDKKVKEFIEKRRSRKPSKL